MFPGLALSLLLASSPDVDGARAELDACAERIEELKARRQAGQATGRELERLLVRAQELAAELATELERSRAELPPVTLAPSPEELRERADASRDEADRLAAEIAELDVKIGDVRRLAHAEQDPTVSRAVLGTGARPSGTSERLRALLQRRAALAERRAQAEADAARDEAEARAADWDGPR